MTRPTPTNLAAQAAGVQIAAARLAAAEAGLRARLEKAQAEAAQASAQLEEAVGLFELAVALGGGLEADAIGASLPGLRAAATAARKKLAAATAAAKGGEIAALRAALGRAERELRRLQEEAAAHQAYAQNRVAARAEEAAIASILGPARAREVMAVPPCRPTAPPAAKAAAPSCPSVKTDGLKAKWGKVA